jgi:hypothetical protein
MKITVMADDGIGRDTSSEVHREVGTWETGNAVVEAL